jgi:chaperonin GroEL
MAKKFKEVIYEDEAREKMLAGVQKLTDAVRITLGPRGRHVVLGKEFGGPKVVDDGATIAEEQEYADEFENLGAQLVKQVAKETNDDAGDGTTTATILAYALIKEGLKNVTAGANAVQLKRGLEIARDRVIEELQKMSKELKTKDEMAQIATNSSKDPEIGRIIADAMEKAGEDGVITVEESDTIETHFEVVEGMQFDRGYTSPYFITNAERMEAELKEPYHSHHRSRAEEGPRSRAHSRKSGADGQAPLRHRR